MPILHPIKTMVFTLPDQTVTGNLRERKVPGDCHQKLIEQAVIDLRASEITVEIQYCPGALEPDPASNTARICGACGMRHENAAPVSLTNNFSLDSLEVDMAERLSGIRNGIHISSGKYITLTTDANSTASTD